MALALGCSTPPPPAEPSPGRRPEASAEEVAPLPEPPRELFMAPGIACVRRPGDRYVCWGAHWPLPIDVGIRARAAPALFQAGASVELPHACFLEGDGVSCWPPLPLSPCPLVRADAPASLRFTAGRLVAVAEAGACVWSPSGPAGADGRLAATAHPGARDVALVDGTTCILNDGKVACSDAAGAVIPLPELDGAAAILAGDDVCGRWDDGRLVCASLSSGPGSEGGARAAPLSFQGVAKASLEGPSPCVVSRSGEVSCWQRGARSVTRLEGVGRVVDVASLADVTLLLDVNGGVSVHRAGWGARVRRVDVPAVQSLAPPPAGARSGEMCFLTKRGEVRCLGDLAAGGPESPVGARHVEGLRDVSELAVAGDTLCALGSGAVHCLGDNSMGLLGEGFVPWTGVDLSAGQPRYLFGAAGVLRLGARPPARAEKLTGWQPASIFVGPGGDTWAVGQNGRVAVADLGCVDGEEPQICSPPFFDDDMASLRSSLALPPERPVVGLARTPLAAGGVFPEVRIPWREIATPGAVVEVAGDRDAADVLAKNGDVLRVSMDNGRPRVKRIASGVRRVPAYGCRIDRSDRLVCDAKVACGVTLAGVADASVTLTHGCAVKRDGSVWCWGESSGGQLGSGPGGGGHRECLGGDGDGRAAREHVPVEVPGVADAVSVGVGSGDPRSRYGQLEGPVSCALRRDGSVWCWGSNGVGQLGARREPDAFRPAKVEGLEGVTELAVGSGQVCVVAPRGLHCWGRGYIGTPWADEPVKVALPPP